MPQRRFYAFSVMFIILLALVAVALTTPAFAGRNEESQQERIDRINREIAERGGHWTAGKTTVGSLPYEQRQKLNGFIPPTAAEWEKLPLRVLAESAELPVYFDWRGHSGVTEAKNQGACGSCWAFATVGQLEAHARIYDLRILDLSEQAVVDCDTPLGDCDGGPLYEAYDLFLARGAVDESCMPYQATDGLPCVMDECEKLAEIDSYWAISSTIAQLKQAIYDYGPVACGMFAHDDLSSYYSGCYDHNYPDDPNHGILLVGWDDYACGGAGAWIIKNSWGTDWGTDGFGYIQYGVCSIGVFPYQIEYHPSAVLVHLTDPNGGEELDVGSSFEITWSLAREVPDSINILLSFDSGANYDSTIVSNLSGTTESYMWTVSNTPVPTARIKVVAWFDGVVGGFDESDADFTIIGPPYRYVSPNGSDYYPYSIPAWAANSVQDAIDAADDFDTIMVEGGYTYEENITVTAKALHLIGGWNSSFTVQDPGLYETALQSYGSVVSFKHTASLPCGIEGFSILNGSGTNGYFPELGNYGGGIFVYDSSPTIKNNLIQNCGYTSLTQFSCGGGIACCNGTITVSGNTITESAAQSGGGIYLYQATGIISGNTISGSSTDPGFTGYKRGGGIYALHSDLTTSDNLIESNTGYVQGGGICGRLSSVSTNGDSIRSNQSSNGGGIYSDHSSLIIYNTCIATNSSNIAAGIYIRGEAISLKNSVISSNISTSMSGGIYADSCWGDWTNNTIDGNSSGYAGNTFLIPAAPIDVRNNIITNGYPSGFDGFDAGGNITFQYNDCFGNNGADVLPIAPDTTNLSSDPLYADIASDDYYLGLHSPCIDAGDPFILDPDGLRSDIGAFGGPGAITDAPAYVSNLAATALNDSTIELTWEEGAGDGLDYFAIYADTSSDFVPGLSNHIGSTPAAQTSFQHQPLRGCRYYRVNLIDLDGHAGGYSTEAYCCTSPSTGDNDMPLLSSYLRQNYPNPFNPTTRISFSIATDSRVSLRIYDVSGRLVKTLLDKHLDAGVYNEDWNGTDESGSRVASGVYFYILTSKDFSRTRKMVLLR